ncbi:uncharacterized protein cubi_00009 [Cryptosporidium ubiquitum]|uniref:Uncharacterized protein n=1 Tax=Cryptosporidium ubiquitum TaxID=857276 RepID=A0A1J4MJQ3_9CRYT|nr:uncharacterized protein cubi_00009 [Cryptosporidium ubiquitum]OII74456.1 hypothetical protein cubi_00009 [Cryptosporidium ubiquitum]
MKPKTVYLGLICITFFFHFRLIDNANLHNNPNKIRILKKSDLEQVESKLLSSNLSVFNQLKCLIRLLDLLELIDKTLNVGKPGQLEILFSIKEGIDAKHSEIKDELLRRNINLLSCADVELIKRFSDLNVKLNESLYEGQTFIVESLIEFLELVRLLVTSITDLQLETFISEEISTENIRDFLLSLSEHYSNLLLSITEQNDDEKERGADENQSENASSSSVPLSKNQDSKATNKLIKDNKNTELERNEKNRNRKEKKSKAFNQKEAYDVEASLNKAKLGESSQRKETLAVSQKSISGGVEQAQASGVGSIITEVGDQKTHNFPKKRTNKKKHLNNDEKSRHQPENILVRHAENVKLDERGGAKQKRGRAKGPKKTAETGSRARSTSPKPHSSRELQASSRLWSRSRSGSRSRRRSRSRSGGRSESHSRYTIERVHSFAQEVGNDIGELGSYSPLFLVQEAEEKLTELLKVEAELLNLSFELKNMFLKMNEISSRVECKGHRFSAVRTQVKILNQGLGRWVLDTDFDSLDIRYTMMDAGNILSNIPPSVAARQGIAARACCFKDCCKLNDPSDKHIVGFNNCDCNSCDCNCIYCSSIPDSFNKKSIYDVD